MRKYTVNICTMLYLATCMYMYLHNFIQCEGIYINVTLTNTCIFAGSPPKTKPLVFMYNKYMLGIDQLDQRMACYQFTRKSVR